ncbi:MAG TPA: alpha-glucan family phosphorylase [Verrucomicrobiae bacterium]|nr:alpha-glucan family phosphorylase [Verrucomicrobiae bacterium]
MNLPFRFTVVPRLPAELEPLREIAYNLWWSWNNEAWSLFRDLDPELWERLGHAPVRLLRKVAQDRLTIAANDPAFVARVQAVRETFNRYMTRPGRWFEQTHGHVSGALVAYFSAEFGFHESMQIYSGGLGILAGDHCKAASDLGVPFIGVGLMYRQGYFLQRINQDGWQESEYVDANFYDLPVTEKCDAAGSPVRVKVQMPHREVLIRAWEVKVGLVNVYLLDTDLPENSAEDRKITHQLYGGDQEMRVKQEIVLGIGGNRLISALDLHPTVFHMNEGHAAFLALERIRSLIVDSGVDFYAALQVVAASTLFTTHTPVPAGNDAFSPELMHVYFGEFLRDLKIPFDEFLRFGRPWENRPTDAFSMTILALRMSRFANGVSAIHGRVSQRLWQPVWPGVPTEEISIGHITNGIHTSTWIAPEIKALLATEMGTDCWEEQMSNPATWAAVERVPDEKLWNIHSVLKGRLVEYARKNVRRHRLRINDSARAIHQTNDILDPDILTIGFARRFATYKRAGLLLRDPDRLARLVTDPNRPVQFVFAGKSHPADEGGKRIIQLVYRASRDPKYKNRIVFLEDYDMDVARHMYHGVDVWMNNPTRPLEASGTSGQKVAPNGAINLSVLDGWWDEAWRRRVNGWAIGALVQTHDPEVQNDFDADSLYNLIEHEIAPLFYDRENGLPSRWIQMMKASIMTVSPVFSSCRQVQDYTEKYYVTAHRIGLRMAENGHRGAREIAEWKARIRSAWRDVKVCKVTTSATPDQGLTAGDQMQVEAVVDLGSLNQSDVSVEAFVKLDEEGRDVSRFFQLEPTGDGRYVGMIQPADTGEFRMNVRVLPFHPLLLQQHELRLITWA